MVENKKGKQFTKKDFLNDLYLFYRYFIASNYVNSVPAPHIKKLSRKLMELHNGESKHRLAVSMPPRHKLSDSTPVLTANKGWVSHGELEIGDYVFGLDGNPVEVVNVSEKEVCDRLITFTNGSQILAHSGHLWGVYKRGNKNLKVIPTEEIEKDFYYVEKNGKKRYRYHLPLINALEYDYVELPIDPYWLGYWLGDGTYNKSCITHSREDSQFIDNVPYEVTSQSVHKDTGVCTTYFSNQGLMNHLKELNLYENKHIPIIYKRASFGQRVSLLAGLIDSDGSVDKNGRVRFVNTNKQLIDDVYELCCGLGLYPYLKYDSDRINKYKENSNSLHIKSRKDCYHIGFQPRFPIPTNVPRKKIVEKGLRRRIAIKNVEKIDGELGQCIEIDNDDGIYLVGKELIPTHNSKSSMVTLAFPLWLLFQNPNVNIMIVTGSPKLAEKFGIQLREYVRELGKYFNVYLSSVKQASTHIMFCDKDNKLYKGNIMLASSGGGITGQDADYLILDDPYTGNDSEFTPTALQQKIDWVNRVVEQRIEPHTKYPIDNDCPVYTINKGWITHGELEVGDTVLNKKHHPTRVVCVHPKTIVDNCFVFSNGDKIISGDDHLWEFNDYINDTTRLFTTREIMDRELTVGKSYLPNFKIPSSTKCVSLIDAYKVEPRQGNCITVEAKDGMYLVGKNSTPTHNCILHTRWHSADLIGYYKESDPEAYDFVEFPAIKEDGTPLWSERYTIEELLKKKETVGERVFQSIYQQQPIDATSDYFNMGMLKFGLPEDYDETYTTRCRAWDIASGNNLSKSDFTAGIYMIRYGDYAIIQDLVHGRFGNKNKQIIVNVAETDTPNVHIVIETGVGAGAKLLFQEWQTQLMGYMVSEAQVSGGKSKVDRATPLQNAIEDGKVYVNIQDPVIRQTFYDELSSFPNGAHDDITDATAHAFNFLFVDNLGKARPRPKIGAVFL